MLPVRGFLTFLYLICYCPYSCLVLMVVIKRRFSRRQKHTFPNGRVWVDSIPGQRFGAISFDSFVLLSSGLLSFPPQWIPAVEPQAPVTGHCVGPMFPPGLFSQHVWAAFAQRLGASSEASNAGPSSAGAGWGGVWEEHGRLQVHCWVFEVLLSREAASAYPGHTSLAAPWMSCRLPAASTSASNLASCL